MTTFITAKLKKSDGQTTIYKYGNAALKIVQNIYQSKILFTTSLKKLNICNAHFRLAYKDALLIVLNLIFLRNNLFKIHSNRAFFSSKNLNQRIKNLHV